MTSGHTQAASCSENNKCTAIERILEPTFCLVRNITKQCRPFSANSSFRTNEISKELSANGPEIRDRGVPLFHHELYAFQPTSCCSGSFYETPGGYPAALEPPAGWPYRLSFSDMITVGYLPSTHGILEPTPGGSNDRSHSRLKGPTRPAGLATKGIPREGSRTHTLGYVIQERLRRNPTTGLTKVENTVIQEYRELNHGDSSWAVDENTTLTMI